MKIVMPFELSDFQHPARPGELKLKMGRTDIGRLLAEAFVIQRIGY